MRSTALGKALTCRRLLSKKSKLRHAYQRLSETATHKQFYPDSFLYRRGEHPYGTREYLLVRPKPATVGTNGEDRPTSETDADGTTTESLAPSQVQVLASLHANNNIVFGATVNRNVLPEGAVKPPSILDLCPILLHAALDDCSDEGEQPQAVSTLHGLSAWVRQCLEGTATSTVLSDLQAQVQMSNADTKAHVELECITAIATGIPRPGHTVVGQGTHREGSRVWEALAREFALLDDDGNSEQFVFRSEECRLYRHCADRCELVQIELLADTSPAYLASAGGCMARFFLQ